MRSAGRETYPWNFFDPNRAWLNTLLMTLLMMAVSIAAFLVYNHLSHDLSPDSPAGYVFATLGTIFLLMAALRYGLYRRSKHKVGKLNANLHWHITFAVVGLTLILLHSFADFNPRSGTYALYALIALALSGEVGRMLDRMLPRFIAMEASKALTLQGEDRMEAVSRSLQSLMMYNAQEIRGTRTGGTNARQPERKAPAQVGQPGGNALPSSWDMAYLTLDETPQEVNRDAQYRFVPDRRSSLAQPGGLLPGVQEHIAELNSVQRALKREQFFRYIIRIWRAVHVFLTLIFIGLTLWHLEFAASLLIPVYFHR